MPKKIPITEKREWLRRYEEGETAVQIKKNLLEGSKYDLKTINSGIEWARLERTAASAQDELVKDRLKDHHDQLLGVVHNILSALVIPERYLPLGKNIKGKKVVSLPIELPESRVTYDSEKGLVLTLKDEDSSLWELLREHMKHDRLWKILDTWKSAVTSHFQARTMLALAVEEIFKTKIGYDIDDDADSPPVLYRYTVDRLIQQVIYIALGGSLSKKLEDLFIVDTRDGIVRWVDDTLAKCPGAEEECKTKVIKVVGDALNSNEAKTVADTYEKIDQPMAKAYRILEEIKLLGMVPGKCRVCRRLGL
jgi:hypothetical protein